MTSTLPSIVQATAGGLGSASENALIYPLDLVTTRIQLESPDAKEGNGGLRHAVLLLRRLVQKYGWSSLYDGLWSDTFATLLSNFLHFYFHSFLRSLSTRGMLAAKASTKAKSSPHKPTLTEELVLGFVAGLVSRIITVPVNVITLRLQLEREDGEEVEPALRVSALSHAIRGVYEEGGVREFWRGKAADYSDLIIKSIYFDALRRMFNAGVLRTILSAPANANLSPWEAFFGGAISNSLAICILYPMILTKTRLQATSTSSVLDVLLAAYQGPKVIREYEGGITPKPHDETKKGKNARGGVVGLYHGLPVQTLKGFLSQGVTFLIKGGIEQLIVALYLYRMGSRR